MSTKVQKDSLNPCLTKELITNLASGTGFLLSAALNVGAPKEFIEPLEQILKNYASLIVMCDFYVVDGSLSSKPE